MIRINEHAFCSSFFNGLKPTPRFHSQWKASLFWNTVNGRSPANQLRLVVYPIIRFFASQVVVWDFWTIKSIILFSKVPKKNLRFLPVMIQLLIFQVPLCHGIRLQDHVPRRNCFEGKVKSEKELADMTSLESKDPQKKSLQNALINIRWMKKKPPTGKLTAPSSLKKLGNLRLMICQTETELDMNSLSRLLWSFIFPEFGRIHQWLTEALNFEWIVSKRWSEGWSPSRWWS